VAKGSSIPSANPGSPGRFWLFRQPFRQIFRGRGDAEQLPGHWPYTIRIYEIYGQMEYIPLPDNVTRQAIDATTVFNEFTRVRDAARPYAGGMYWKRQGEYEYLVKTSPDNRQRRIGPRSAETEKTYQEFNARKVEIEARPEVAARCAHRCRAVEQGVEGRAACLPP